MNYTKQNNTFIYNPKSDIEVEIGDIKQVDFYPQVKIKKWDNEVNFSARLKNDEVIIPVEKDGIISIDTPTKEIKFYEVADSKKTPEGGYEFQINLKEKPLTNKIEFTIETKGLDFFYQPPLTQDELEAGVFRPLHVEGSYAVYHKTKSNNDYKTGKVLHIYRPQIEDSKENMVWGELNIDIEKGLLTVTIPQDFLDNAIYPIKHVAGLTFGYTTSGGSNTSTKDSITGSVFAGAAGTGVSISSYSYVNGGDSYKFALYVHSDLTPLTNGATAAGSGDMALGLHTLNFSSAPTLTAIDYIIVQWSNNYDAYSSNTYLKYDSGSADQGHVDAATYGTWPNPLVPTHSTNKYSIYCTYNAVTVNHSPDFFNFFPLGR